MDNENNRVKLFCSQRREIVGHIRSGGVHRAKLQYIREKYGEASPVFMYAYSWYANNAEKIVPRPEGAESGIWAFASPQWIDRDEACGIMELDVPADTVVLFRMSDWNKILNLSYLGKDDSDLRQFAEKIAQYGIRDESDILMQPYYPQLKQEILRSWDGLFRYDSPLKRGEIDFPDIQAGLWELRGEWVASWNCC